jgi:hypothetical protein
MLFQCYVRIEIDMYQTECSSATPGKQSYAQLQTGQARSIL